MKIGIYLLSLITVFFIYDEIEAQPINWLWANATGNSEHAGGNDIAVNKSDNTIYTTGEFTQTVDFDPGPGQNFISSHGGDDIFITKFDESGNLIWAKTIGGPLGDGPNSIAVDPSGSGDIYITGSFVGDVDFDPGPGIKVLESEGSKDGFVVKLDTDGNLLWAISIGDASVDEIDAVTIDPSNGDFYVSGNFSYSVDFDPGPGVSELTAVDLWDAFVARFNHEGELIWAKAMGGGGSDYGRSIALDPSSGEVVISGHFEETVDFNPGPEVQNIISQGDWDVFVSKFDSSGNYLWTKSIGGGRNDISQSLAIDGSGDIYIGGGYRDTVDFDPDAGVYQLISGGLYDFYIWKLNSTGGFIWAKTATIGGDNEDLTSILIDPSSTGGIYAMGSFSRPGDFDTGDGVFMLTPNERDIYILKLKLSGEFEWALNVGGSEADLIQAGAFDGHGNIYITGSFFGSTSMFGNSTITNNSTSGRDQFVAKFDDLSTSTKSVNVLPVSIYPNPFSAELNVEVDNDEFNSIEIKLYNLLGEVVLSEKSDSFEHKKTINVSLLTAGIYIIELNINGSRMIKKVIKIL